MFGLFRAMKAEGEDAVRRTVWLVSAAALGLLAVAFVAVAATIAMSAIMPIAAALIISAGVIAIAGVVCLLFAEHEDRLTKSRAVNTMPAKVFNAGVVDQATRAVLVDKLRRHPAGVLAIAAAAGVAVAALDLVDRD